MTDRAGFLNEPDLVEECARALYEEDNPWSDAFPWPNVPTGDGESAENYMRLSIAVIALLRKRGLLTIQALELLASSSIRKPINIPPIRK